MASSRKVLTRFRAQKALQCLQLDPALFVSGIPDSLSCIPDSKDQDFGFHKQKFPRIPEFGFPHVARKLAALLARTSLPFVNLNGPEKLKG